MGKATVVTKEVYLTQGTSYPVIVGQLNNESRFGNEVVSAGGTSVNTYHTPSYTNPAIGFVKAKFLRE